MLLLEERVRVLKRLQLFDLPDGSRRRCWSTAPPQDSVARILPPLRQHERVDLERRGNGLHLHPRLLTEPDRGQLELVGVATNRAWT